MSLQLDPYLRLRAGGATMTTAAVEAGIPIAEARLTENAILRGELALPDTHDPAATDAAFEAGGDHASIRDGQSDPEQSGRDLHEMEPSGGGGQLARPRRPGSVGGSLPRPGERNPDGRSELMARKAANDEVEIVQKPDFERAARILRGDVKPAEEANAKSRGDLSAAWKTIESDCHVNKKAAKDSCRLLNMSPELRDDYLRSLYGMMAVLGIGISRDLVDQMGDGEAPTMPVSDEKATTAGDLAAVAAE